MTNEQIIFNESMELMKDGKLKGTGKYVRLYDTDGEREIELPETIHTFAKWKSLGYKVRKGEKAVAQFPIWKATVKAETMADKNGNEITEDITKVFMKKASFFSESQVERV